MWTVRIASTVDEAKRSSEDIRLQEGDCYQETIEAQKRGFEDIDNLSFDSSQRIGQLETKLLQVDSSPDPHIEGAQKRN